MEIKTRPHGEKPQITLVALAGRLDALTGDQAEATVLAALAASPAGLLLDFRQVSFISSAGLRFLLTLHKEAAAAGKPIGLTAVPPPVYKLFKLASLEQEFRVFEDEPEAIRQLWPD